MLAEADIRAVDTAPDQLRITTRVGPLPAVAVHRLAVGRTHLDLRILAASHQVVVHREAQLPHVETVACELATPWAEPLVDGSIHLHGSWQAAASIVDLDADGLAAQARHWIERAATDDRCVAVIFPNHPHALTAVVAEVANGELLGWTGVHLYPSADGGGQGVVVRTTTRSTTRTTNRTRQEVPA